MSKAKLRRFLSAHTKEQVIDIMLELYDAKKEAKEYLEFYLSPNYDAELEKCKKLIRNEFFPARGCLKDPSFAKCRKVISDFRKLKPDPKDVADLMLFYIEQGCQFTIMFGDMWEQFYITMETNFEKALNFIFLNGLLLNYYERIENLIYSVNNCGWGFSDSLMDIYHKYR